MKEEDKSLIEIENPLAKAENIPDENKILFIEDESYYMNVKELRIFYHSVDGEVIYKKRTVLRIIKRLLKRQNNKNLKFFIDKFISNMEYNEVMEKRRIKDFILSDNTGKRDKKLLRKCLVPYHIQFIKNYPYKNKAKNKEVIRLTNIFNKYKIKLNLKFDTELLYDIKKLFDILNKYNLKYTKYFSYKIIKNPIYNGINKLLNSTHIIYENRIRRSDIVLSFWLYYKGVELKKILKRFMERGIKRSINVIVISDKIISLVENFCYSNEIEETEQKIIDTWIYFLKDLFSTVDVSDGRTMEEKYIDYIKYLIDVTDGRTAREVLQIEKINNKEKKNWEHSSNGKTLNSLGMWVRPPRVLV